MAIKPLEEKHVQLGLLVPDDHYAALVALADERGVSLSSVGREIIERIHDRPGWFDPDTPAPGPHESSVYVWVLPATSRWLHNAAGSGGMSSMFRAGLSQYLEEHGVRPPLRSEPPPPPKPPKPPRKYMSLYIPRSLADAVKSDKRTKWQVIADALSRHGEAAALAAADASGRRRSDPDDPLDFAGTLVLASDVEALDRAAAEAGATRSALVTELLRLEFSAESELQSAD